MSKTLLLLKRPKLIPYADINPDLVDDAETIINQALSKSQPHESPTLIHLCGIPGSGKTTYTARYLQLHPEFVGVQFDAVMERLPGYIRDRESKDIVAAFKEWELPARAIGYHLLQALLENSRNVIFDHSASSRDHLELLDTVNTWGYKTEMHRILCPPEIALARVKNREIQIRRHTPEHLVWDRCKILEDLVPLYRARVSLFLEIKNY